ncbi:magnesium/cobalt transporter CorA [Gordonia alkaliphila]|uniref:Magnesium/cobalt transporter CorA n=1 Tax=Gordonia alkaliphila TaxID=1053547 RepID=A0ABP8Z6S5_9ACTN
MPPDRAVVDCAVYRGGRREPGYRDFASAYAHVRATGSGFVWLGLHAPGEAQMDEVGRIFGLHPLAVEDVVEAHQRPKLELYDGLIFLVLRSMSYVAHDSIDRANDIVDGGEIMVLAGRDFVITVRHGEHTQLAGVRARMEARPQTLALGPAAVVHAVADHVVDTYLEVVAEMAPDVDEVEERVFAVATTDLDIDVVYLFKREVMELHRAVAPLAEPLAWLSGQGGPGSAHPPGLRGAHTGSFDEKEVHRHFRDVRDHLTTVIERIGEYDDRLTSLLHAAATKVGIQQNTDMRKISSWAAIAAVPTMVAGLYGMNFEFMPELSWRWSYPVLLAILFTACVLLWRLLHRNRWL